MRQNRLSGFRAVGEGVEICHLPLIWPISGKTVKSIGKGKFRPITAPKPLNRTNLYNILLDTTTAEGQEFQMSRSLAKHVFLSSLLQCAL